MPLRASIANSLRSFGSDRTDTRGPIKTTLIDYFVLSGGGGGGAYGGGGGGGGGFLVGSGFPVSPGDYFTVSVGGGADVSPVNDNNDGHGASGGSGRVILRYSEYYDPLIINSGSPDIIRADGYRVYDFKGSGSFTI